MKRTPAVYLAILMAATVLSACGNQAAQIDGKEAGGTVVLQSPDTASGEGQSTPKTAAGTGTQLLNASGAINRPISVDPTGLSEGFSAVIYDNSNGLPTAESNAIAETSDGLLWIGSYAGLIRYDGNTFERLSDTGGIASIKCLYVDSKDRLWIGSNDNGVAVMERGEYRLWGKLDGMKSAHTRAITEDQNGTI